MIASLWWLGLLAISLPVLLLLQRRGVVGWTGTMLCVIGVLFLGGVWIAVERKRDLEKSAHEERIADDQTPQTSESCIECHRSRYASWQMTYHRTMTREATPENVKAIFDGAEQHFYGITTRMTREGDRFFMETVDPSWATRNGSEGDLLTKGGPSERCKLSVDRVVGSHWFQQFLHREEGGRYLRLPMAFHIAEKRWIHVNGVFLTPDPGKFTGLVYPWNESCVFCHNTRPSKNPQPPSYDQPPGYRTEVGELGISCEACHGAAANHVRAHRSQDREPRESDGDSADPTIINPARLSVSRSDDVCAHCHGGGMPRMENWNRDTEADPFLAGKELKQFWHLLRSDEEQQLVLQGRTVDPSHPPHPGPLDSRFWGDGTPLTTALEYQGMAMSACYQEGRGKMSCLTCHSMHGGDINHQLKDGMRTNSACYKCHEDYQRKLVQHTHHSAESSGSLCSNCHMPHQVYSLLDTHRSHRIMIPRIRDSIGTGKPHACNLCHLDKSLGWTQDQLGRWYGTKPEPLTEDDRAIASSVLQLTRGDARTRAVVAGALGWAPAQQVSGRDWPAQLLILALENERFQAVRFTAHKSLKSLQGSAFDDYDFQGSTTKRESQLLGMRSSILSMPRPDRSRYPYLPLTNDGLFSDDVLNRLLRSRNDPDVNIRE
jgi:predicted CXXCH cytochrome family protein